MVSVALRLDVFPVDPIRIGFVPEFPLLHNIVNETLPSLLQHVLSVIVPTGLHCEWVHGICLGKLCEVLANTYLPTFLHNSQVLFLNRAGLFETPHELFLEAIFKSLDSCLILSLIELSITVFVKHLGQCIVSHVDWAVSIQVICDVRNICLSSLPKHYCASATLTSFCQILTLVVWTPPVRDFCNNQVTLNKKFLTNIIF